MPLHIRRVNALLGEAIAVTGNKAALLKLKRQIDRALEGVEEYPIEDGMYEDVYGEPFQVFVKHARKRSKMEEPGPEPVKSEETWWSEKAKRSAEARRLEEQEGG